MKDEKNEIIDAEVEAINEETNSERENVEPEKENDKDKKIKNLISLVILIGGLFVGSLFVDVIQLIKGGGFSERALSSSDVLSIGGKTWVAYAEPIVKIQIINDDSCETCKPDEALVGLRRVMPTMLTEKVDVNSKQGKDLLAKFEIKSVPAYVFSSEVEKTDLYLQAQALFEKRDDQYALKTAELGLPLGKYVTAPSVGDKDITIGSSEATIKVVAFSDFANPADKQFYQTSVAQMLKDYGDKVQFVFKTYFPPSAIQSANAALAAQCSNEQGKFQSYADKLFANQAVWGKAKDTSLFKVYAAQVGINTQQFNKCLDDKEKQDNITESTNEGQAFALNATPSIFVNDQFQSAGGKYDDIKKAIDDQLNK